MMKVLLEVLGDAKKALSDLDAVDQLRPEARRRLRELLEELREESADVLEELDGTDEAAGASRGALLDRALAAMARDRHDEAEEILKRGLEDRPGDVELLNHLGLARWEQGALEQAELAYARAMQAGLSQLERMEGNACAGAPGEYLRAVEGRALCLYRLEKFDRAVDLFETLGAWAPEDFSGCFYLAGEIRHLQGRPEEAIEYYRRAPDEPSVYYNLGLAHYQNGDDVRAARSFVRGVSSNPHVAAGLLGREDEQVAGPGGYLGSATYAEEFLGACADLWKTAGEAITFLEECWEHPSVRDQVTTVGSGEAADSETPELPGRRDLTELDGIASEVVERTE